MERKPPKPRPTPQAQELARLRARNAKLTAQLNADADAQRKQARRAELAARARRPAPPVAMPFQMVDPRRVPQLGTKVLPALTPPLAVARRMAAAVISELREMTLETRALIKAMAASGTGAMDGPADTPIPPSEAQRKLKALQARWHARFTSLAEQWSRRMITDVLAQSSAQLNMSLKDVAERMAIQSTMSTKRMRAIVEAATQSSTDLITRIPQRYLDEVQVQVMSAITTGSGLDKLVPYLTKRYKGDARHARFVALDQVRKASENVNATRLQSLGVEEFVWIHVGGERYPRKLHQRYSGRTFRYDNLPIIDERTGERGKPGDAINCRCRQRAVLNFTKMREVA